jgi:NAD(P)-dependent dehydrogenase (short-subunit alcohol dehydrogenase family)
MPSRLFAPGLLDGQVPIVTGGGSGLGRATGARARGVRSARRGGRAPSRAARGDRRGLRGRPGHRDLLRRARGGPVEAVENRMRVLSIEWSRFNIRLTALVSGHFDTDALEK